MVDLDAVGLRSYVSEPRRGKRRCRGDRQGQEAVYANRRRIRGERGQRLLIQVSAFNLGMLMRQSLGVGTPRGSAGADLRPDATDFVAVQAS